MLKLNGVTVVYPDNTKAVDCVGLSVGEGESVALLGGNGAGKTSLLLAIVGILELSGGAIEIDGMLLNKKTVGAFRNKIGLVFQNPDDQLFMPYVYDDVAFGCRNCGMPEDEIKTKVDETLSKLKIGRLRDRSSMKLSGGEKRLAAIATVLVMRPSVLMFDEPTAFLDPSAKRALVETLNRLKQTKIIATHDLSFAAETCGRAVLLKNGSVAADGGLSLLDDAELMRSCGLA